jgi:hypothetical protein
VTNRQQGDLTSIKIRGGYTDRWTDRGEYTDRQQGDLISLVYFFQNKERMLKWILENRMGRYELDSSGLGKGPVKGSCEHGNEPSGSINIWEILE